MPWLNLQKMEEDSSTNSSRRKQPAVLCRRCRIQNVEPEGRLHHMCRHCLRNHVKVFICKFCRAEFAVERNLLLKDEEQSRKSTEACKICTNLHKEFGEPNKFVPSICPFHCCAINFFLLFLLYRCECCGIRAAFSKETDVKSCLRCTKWKERYGDPVLCKSCEKPRAFKNSQIWPLCFPCSYQKNKIERRKRSMDKERFKGVKRNLQEEVSSPVRKFRNIQSKRSSPSRFSDRCEKKSLLSLADLPSDVLVHCISYLDGSDLFLQIRGLNRRFLSMVQSNSTWKHVRCLSFSHYRLSITDDVLISSILTCPVFKKYEIPFGEKDTHSSSHFKVLDLSYCKKLSTSIEIIFSLFTGLEVLNLNGCVITPRLLDCIVDCIPTVKDLRLSNFGRPSLSDESFIRLMSLAKNLEILDIEGWNVSDRFLLHEATFPFQSLRALDLSFNNLTDWGIRSRADKFLSSDLRYLDISGISNIRNEALLSISQSCPNLIYLNLRHTSIRNTGILHVLSNCRNLEYLDLSSTEITDELFLDFLNRETCHLSLKKLWIHDCTYLITPEDHLIHVGACFPHLNFLDISECISLNDSCIENLARNLTKLESVNLGSLIKLTNHSIVSLILNNRRLQTIYVGGCPYIKESGLANLARKYPFRLVRHDVRQDSVRTKYLNALSLESPRLSSESSADT